MGHQQWLEIVVQAYHITQFLLREILVNMFNTYHLTPNISIFDTYVKKFLLFQLHSHWLIFTLAIVKVKNDK